MRSLYAIGLGLLATTIAIADDTALIEWNPERNLSWDDFVGSVPSGASEKRVAATTASLSWSYEYTLEWSRNTCTFSITDINSTALFHPDSSWVREGHRTDAVLLHEQGHFEITQYYKNIFEVETRKFVGTSRNCRGNTERRVARFVEGEIAQLVGSIYDDVWQQYRRHQDSYDAETQHGSDPDAQAEWTQNLATLLQDAKLL